MEREQKNDMAWPWGPDIIVDSTLRGKYKRNSIKITDQNMQKYFLAVSLNMVF